MKVQILQENLVKGVIALSKLCVGSGKLPILSHILFQAKTEGLWLSATDLELSVVLKMGAKVEEEGEIAVPARILGEFLGSLEAGKLILSAESEQLEIASGTHRAKMQGMGAKEFPEIPTKIKEGLFSFEKDFEDVVGMVALSAASDESRPALTGVLCEAGEKGLQMTATDGYRLSTRLVGMSGKKEKEGKNKKWVVPARTLIEIIGLVKGLKYEEVVNVGETEDGNQLIFQVGEMVVVSRLLADEFPNVEQIIPKQGETTIVVGKEELYKAVKMAAIFARESANIIRLSVNKSDVVITANSPQVGENESKIDAKVTGPMMTIAFNSRYLLDILTAVTAKEVILSVSGALAPGLFTFEGIKDFLHVIMPVRVQE